MISNIFLFALSGVNIDLPAIFGFFLVFCLIFFLLRKFFLWFWKLEEICTNQNKQIELLALLVKSSHPELAESVDKIIHVKEETE